MDTLKEKQQLEEMLERGNGPWRCGNVGQRRRDAALRRTTS